MDVIIEGKITEDERIDEILRTCAEIKSVQTPVLRINDDTSGLQGRIGFSQGGYIIGGKIVPSGENGYEAVRKLLRVTAGNYAILDPLKKHITDVNQSLWLKVDKVVPLLPNLPENPEGLVDPHPQDVARKATGQLEPLQKFEPEEKKDPLEKEAPVTVTAKSKSRKFNLGSWRIFRAGLCIFAGFAIVLSVFVYHAELIGFFNTLFGQK